ncbi:MAG: hypothetical protein ACJ788_20135 [Ktedonobacteraceae bacterium]|jgi:hypothetical protein
MMLTHASADLKTSIRLHYVTEGEGKLILTYRTEQKGKQLL